MCHPQIEVEVVSAPGITKAANCFYHLPPEHHRGGWDDVPVKAQERQIEMGLRLRWRHIALVHESLAVPV
jgi:hypothetical protein